jgi:hypothetical protein
LNSKFEVLCPYKASCDHGLTRGNPGVDTLGNTWGVTSEVTGLSGAAKRQRAPTVNSSKP